MAVVDFRDATAIQILAALRSILFDGRNDRQNCVDATLILDQKCFEIIRQKLGPLAVTRSENKFSALGFIVENNGRIIEGGPRVE